MQVDVLADFDGFADQHFDDNVGDFVYVLGSSSATSFTIGYKATLVDPLLHDYYYRGGLDFLNFTGVTAGSTVSAVDLVIRTTSQDGSGGDFDVRKASDPTRFSLLSDPQTFWNSAETGTTLYATTSLAIAAPHIYVIPLGATIVADVQARVGIASNPLSIGISEVDITSVRRFVQSVDAGSTNPALRVTFTPPPGSGGTTHGRIVRL